MSQRKVLSKLVPSTISQQQVSIIDLLPQLLDLPGLSQNFLTKYIKEENLDSESVDKYFDISRVNRQVMIEYLQLYIKYRFPEEVGYVKAATNMLKKGYEVLKKTVTNEEELDSETLKKIVREVTEKIEAANTFKDFYNLIGFVRKKAEEAQGKKTFNSNSLLWSTLHGLAGLIIHELKRCPGFKLKLAALNEMVIQKIQQIRISNTEKYGEDTEDYNIELKALYFDLAQLGDVNAIYEAMQLGLLPYLKKMQGAEHRGKYRVHKAIPTCLQEEFFLFLYCSKYQIEVTHKEFKTFAQEARTQGIAEANKRQLEVQSERMEAEADRSLASIQSKKTNLMDSLTVDDYLPESPTPTRKTSVPSEGKNDDQILYEDEEPEVLEKPIHPIQTPGVGLFKAENDDKKPAIPESNVSEEEEVAELEIEIGEEGAPTSSPSTPSFPTRRQ